MSDIPQDDIDRPASNEPPAEPLRDGDSSVSAERDPAQREWERTEAVAEGADPAAFDTATATGADPDEIPADDDEIPAADIHPASTQPETQGTTPVDAELGDAGQGDLAPEDL